MLLTGFAEISSQSEEILDKEVLQWMGMVFSGIGPIMFGILWDPSKA